MERGGGAHNHYVMGASFWQLRFVKKVQELCRLPSQVLLASMGALGLMEYPPSLAFESATAQPTTWSLITMECLFLWESGSGEDSAPKTPTNQWQRFNLMGLRQCEFGVLKNETHEPDCVVLNLRTT